ncbi:STAS domain-containing protein [Nucisporomicrobium flavum]|uniref:STAS domain-containing protein n=1 Tax=Nucisporomicrobium flavum TaxID=2785915 RepID=UPI003C2C8D66
MFFLENAPAGSRHHFLVLALSGRPGVVTVSLCGELDHAVAPELSSQANAMPVRSGTVRVRLDLSGLTFVDVAGARAVIALYAEWAARGYDVALIADSPVLTEMLGLMGCRGAWLRLTAAWTPRPVPLGAGLRHPRR